MVTGQLMLAMIHLHEADIVYRDLKPENVMLDATGHIRLVDFGLCKSLPVDGLTYTFCSTPEYLAPEIITGVGHGHSADGPSSAGLSHGLPMTATW